MSRAAASGSCRAQRLAGGGPVNGCVTGGQVRFRQCPGPLDRAQPYPRRPALTGASEHRQGAQFLDRAGRGLRGGDDRRVRQYPSGCDIAPRREFVSRSPQLAHDREPPRILEGVDPGGAAPAVGFGGGGPGATDVLELLRGPLRLALPLELVRHRVPELDEDLDIECRVVQPGVGKRPGGPVRSPVPLAQFETEGAFDDGGQPHSIEAGQPSGQLGVVEHRRSQPQLVEAGQVLVGGVQHPLEIVDRRGERGERPGRRDRVEQYRAGAGPSQLHQVGPRGVPETRGAFRVDGEWSPARGECFRGRGHSGSRGDDLGDPVPRGQQRDRCPRGLVLVGYRHAS